MKRSCSACGRIHDTKFICPARRRYIPSEKTEQQSFRSSAAWTHKSLLIRERDLFLCRACLAEGIITRDGLEVHHIIPLAEDYERRLDEDNLITLCKRHHELAEAGRLPRKLLQALAGSPPGAPEDRGCPAQDHKAPAVNEIFPK